VRRGHTFEDPPRSDSEGQSIAAISAVSLTASERAFLVRPIAR